MCTLEELSRTLHTQIYLVFHVPPPLIQPVTHPSAAAHQAVAHQSATHRVAVTHLTIHTLISNPPICSDTSKCGTPSSSKGAGLNATSPLPLYAAGLAVAV